MHRAAERALRTTSGFLHTFRSLSFSSGTSRRGILSSSSSSPFSTNASHRRRQPHHFSTASSHEPIALRSSMHFRRLPVALVSSIVVGYGAWYSYNTNSHNSPIAGSSTAAQSLTSSQTAAQPTRTVLVVGADELRQGTIVGDGPITKATGDGRHIVEMLTPDQATQKLRKMEQSFAVNRGQGVTRYDLVQLPSNDPIEDDHAEKIVEVSSRLAAAAGNSDWMFWGVFDGHSGWTTSATLRENLISYVATELNKTYKATPEQLPSQDAIESAIKTGFTRLDHEIVHTSVEKVLKSSSKSVAAELLQPALSGSCALLSFYDAKSSLLRVACTGDSRAVLGRRSESGKWTATALSVDQTGGNIDEANRMRKEHPGEDHVIRNGRVLGGLEPTRAFGDAVYKWSRDTAYRLKDNFFARSPSPLLKTPPYVTAEPVVTTTKVHPEKGDFLVLATDGLWEMLTNEEVVGLVGQWIETEKTSVDPSQQSQFNAAWNKIFGGAAAASSSKSSLPVEHGKPGGGADGGQRTPIRVQQWGIDPEAKDRFVVKDKNVATHLVRNALGGRNDEQVSALLTLPAPFSRRYRDDLTVQVIFFGNGDKSGDVVVNQAATADDTPKAKL